MLLLLGKWKKKLCSLFVYKYIELFAKILVSSNSDKQFDVCFGIVFEGRSCIANVILDVANVVLLLLLGKFVRWYCCCWVNEKDGVGSGWACSWSDKENNEPWLRSKSTRPNQRPYQRPKIIFWGKIFSNKEQSYAFGRFIWQNSLYNVKM